MNFHPQSTFQNLRATPKDYLPQPLRKLLAPHTSQAEEPATQLILSMAKQRWRLLAVSLGTSVIEALSEGATLGVVYLAVDVLSSPASSRFNWSAHPVLGLSPEVASWLNSLPATAVFSVLLALAVLLQGLQSLSRFANSVSVGYFAAECVARVTARIHSQVLRFSFACASGYKVGDLTDYANQGPLAIRNQIEQTGQLLVLLLLSVTYLAVLVGISPWLLFAVILIGGLITLLQKRMLPRIRAGSKSVSQAQVAISSRITEDFQGLRLLHSCGQLEAADLRLQKRMDELRLQLRAQARRLALVQPFSTFLPILAIAVISAISLLLLGGRSSGVLPSLVTFVLALQRLNVKLVTIATTTNILADNKGRMDRLNQILRSEGKIFRRLDGIPFGRLQREIRFERVTLQYGPELPPALSQISFTLPVGQMMAVVGPSGAGKSSIADLLCGLYAPAAGQIWIDNTPLNQLNLASWQQRIGVVSQDTYLFNATIAENISFGTPRATQAQIEESCETAQAAGFIESLPQGYDTLLGERGYRLSGGQRQRLSLARAILRDPELLILDEATSALDSQNEQLVQKAIERFERNHTVLVIAHRLSTIVKADQILVLDGGCLMQQGTHTSLLAESDRYQQLWHQQSNAGKPEFT